ncbi:MAG: MerR family transcriptional regulator [Clostridiales bacterium]|nr:MerR family transcriptional regulator [Clostridiales bacterium]MCD8224754.1 MerR family transcriptional regulator [Clostridiales bacterium]
MPDESKTVNKFYAVSPAMMDDFIKKAVQAGIEAFQKKESERIKREEKERDPVRHIKEMLSGYRRIKKTLQEEAEYTPEEQREYRMKFIQDLMGDPIRQNDRTERLIKNREEKRRLDQYTIFQIDKALESYRQECEETDNEEFKRRYRELKRYHIDEPALTIEKIAESENVSEKTVYRDLGISYKIMYQYIIGL